MDRPSRILINTDRSEESVLTSLSFQASLGVGGTLWRSLGSLAEGPRDGWTGLSLPAIARAEPRSTQARPESGARQSLPPRLPSLPRCGWPSPPVGRIPARASGWPAPHGRPARNPANCARPMCMTFGESRPSLSVVIPVYNEDSTLRGDR